LLAGEDANMCGIAGYYRSDGGVGLDLSSMTDALAHRGPDDCGTYVDGPLGLGHRRLSILDLSPLGHQPMASPDGRLVIVFNGEIFNYLELRAELATHGHAFRTGSDTEVILAAYAQWGRECLHHFNGMWAFALWDAGKEELFCSRDRFGVKPFCYLQREALFAFASEPKGILAALPEERLPDLDNLCRYFTYGIVHDEDRTFYRNIRQLPAGHNLLISRSGTACWRYWDYPRPDSGLVSAPAAVLTERFRELFLDAVRLRARSDVEVGTTLSGGLDSSAIVAAFRHLFPEQRHCSYSAVFTGPGYDETEYVEAVVDHYHLIAHQIKQEVGDLQADVVRLVRHLDGPLISPAIIPLDRVLGKARADGIVVLYDGQGADEILAGYDNQFYPPYLHSLLRRTMSRPAYGAMQMLGALGGMTTMRAQWLARYAAPASHGLYRRAISTHDVLTPEFRALAGRPPSWQRHYADQLADSLCRAHAQSILPALLHYGDGVSMANSVEYRLPFMDYRLVEFTFSLPVEQKVAGGWTKAILRNAMEGLLIDKIRRRRWKNGFTTPIREWLLQSPDLLARTIHSSSFASRGIFDSSIVRGLLPRLADPVKGARLANHFLRWVTTELWFQECIDGKN
jgi:asparagine synthase (glutamine-hydrolysing)